MVKTFVIDANRLSREGLAHLLSKTSFDVVGHAPDVRSVLADGSEISEAELVLVGATGASAELRDDLQALRKLSPEPKIVVLSTTVHPKAVATYFAADVDGCLHQDISSRALIASLDLILAGERVFPSQVMSVAFRHPSLPTGDVATGKSDRPNISKREQEILQLLVDGLSNKGIANQLDVAEATVKVHLKSILRKIGVQNRTQAAIWALGHGMGPALEDRRAS